MTPHAPLLAAFLAPLAAVPPTAALQHDGRLRPPGFVTCDRNHLTSYTGRVVSLDRSPDRTTLRIETDEATRESLVIRHPGGDVRRFFRMDGEPFAEADWTKILADGRLRPGARATAWVCTGQENPIVDWEHPR